MSAPGLFLVVGGNDDELTGEISYVRQPATLDRLNYLRAEIARVRQASRDNSNIKEMLLEDRGVEFVWDGGYNAGAGPIGDFYERVEEDADAITVTSVDGDDLHVLDGWATLMVRPSSVYWTFRSSDRADYWSYELFEASLVAALALVCPAPDLESVLGELAVRDPHQLAAWLETGHIRSDDGALSRPLPRLPESVLATLLESDDPRVRQQAILALRSVEGPSQGRAR